MSVIHSREYKKDIALKALEYKKNNPDLAYKDIAKIIDVGAFSNIPKWIKQLQAGKLEENVEEVEKILRSDIKYLSIETKELKETLDTQEDAIAEILEKVREIHKMIKDEHDEIKADAAKAIENLNNG